MVRPKQVNLISEELLKKAFPRKVKAKGGGMRVLLTVLAVIILFLTADQASKVVNFSLKVADAKRKMQEAKTKLNQMHSQALELEKMKNELVKDEALKKQRLEFLLSSSSQETNYANLLSLVSSFVPQDLWINRFEISKTEVGITGTALNPQLITQFMNQLNSSGIFSNSHFTSSEKQEIESTPVHNFKLTTEPVWDVLSKNRLDEGHKDKSTSSQ